MNRFWDEIHDAGRPEDEQAAVTVSAFARAFSGACTDPGGCPPPELLVRFASGAPEAGPADVLLQHLSRCARCRAREDALRRHSEPRPLLTWNLPALRQAAGEERGRAARVRSDVRAWLEGLLNRASTLKAEAELEVPAVWAPAAGPLALVDFRLESPAALDRQGRLALELTALAPVEGPGLVVAIQDSEHRLELCAVPVKESKVSAIVDCAFLGLPAGAIPARHLRLSLVPVEQARRWGAPRILGALRMLFESPMDAAGFFDGVTAALGAHGDLWQESLRREVAGMSVPSEGVAVVQAVMDQVSLYSMVWRESNGAGHPEEEEILEGLGEIALATRRPGRAKPQAQADATVTPGRPQKSRRKAREGQDV